MLKGSQQAAADQQLQEFRRDGVSGQTVFTANIVENIPAAFRLVCLCLSFRKLSETAVKPRRKQRAHRRLESWHSPRLDVECRSGMLRCFFTLRVHQPPAVLQCYSSVTYQAQASAKIPNQTTHWPTLLTGTRTYTMTAFFMPVGIPLDKHRQQHTLLYEATVKQPILCQNQHCKSGAWWGRRWIDVDH